MGSKTNTSFYLQWIALLASVALCVLIMCSVYVLYTTRTHIAHNIDTLTPAQTVMILGAGVYQSGELSLILKDRVDTALSIYQAGKANRILVSGDNSTSKYNEVIPVRQYLLERGVPADHIFLDYAGFNTYDSMYRARDVFEVDSAIIVTQAFHMPRAVYIADALGISVQGYPSEITDIYLSNHIREMLARVKSVIEVAMHRQPRFLGETYPIEGDGTDTIGPEAQE